MQSFLEQKGSQWLLSKTLEAKDRQTTSPGWVIKGKTVQSCREVDMVAQQGATEGVSPTARPWPGRSPVLNGPSENLTSSDYLLTNWTI